MPKATLNMKLIFFLKLWPLRIFASLSKQQNSAFDNSTHPYTGPNTETYSTGPSSRDVICDAETDEKKPDNNMDDGKSSGTGSGHVASVSAGNTMKKH